MFTSRPSIRGYEVLQMDMKFILVLFILLGFMGCQGTIEDPSKVDNSVAVNESLQMLYSGIQNVFPVAHDAVQVVVNPVTTISNNYSFLVFKNGNFTAPVASTLSSSVKLDSNGKVNIIVRGLDAGQTNFFSVRLYDSVTGLMDANTKKLSATTFSVEHPVYDGIKSVENVGGLLANTALKINWSKAQAASINSIFDPNFITGYIIYYKKFGGSVQTVLIADPNATSYVINGLEENTLYYFYVHALDGHAPSREDANKMEMSKATLGEVNVTFAGIKTATVPSNMSGLNNITISWDAGSGPFTYYRIFYTSNTAFPIITPTVGLPVETIDIFDTTKTSHTFYVPLQVTDYVVGVAACSGANCAVIGAEGAGVLLPVSTIPLVAPFTGMDAIDGEIDNVVLRWSNYPDGIHGAFNSYKIMGYNKTQGGVPASASEITTTINGDGLTLESVPAGAAKSIRVLGLTLNEEYCFKVESRLSYNLGESTYPNNSWFCKVAAFIPASQVSFLNAPNSTPCHNISTDGFEVRWTPPTVGNVSSYQVYITAGPTVNWLGSSYQVLHSLAETSFKYAFNNFPAGVTYSVGVRPIYGHPTLGIFNGTDSVEVSCTTLQKNLVPGEWVSMVALGQKMNGLATDPLPQNRVIPEVFMNPGQKFQDDIETDFSLPAEHADVLGLPPASNTNSSKGGQGFIRLSWLDYEFENEPGKTFSIGQTDPTLGYDVYRQPYLTPDHASGRPSQNDANWTKVSTTPVKASTFYVGVDTLNLASFSDYTLPAVQVTDPSGVEARAFWYKVVPVLNGNNLPLVGTLLNDYVVKVILPPRNMASIHPWNVNRETCKRLKRSYDRNNNYRCPFNGLLSKTINAGKYFDFGGHLLIDRFEAGCRFSRSLCNKTETGVFGGGVQAGDCIGVDTPTLNSANTALFNNTVRYKRVITGGDTCQIYSGSWQALDSVSASIAKQAVSNDANLPPLGDISKSKLNSICGERSLKFTSGGSTPTNISLTPRLPTKAEYVAVNAPALETLNYRNVELGNIERGCSVATTVAAKSAFTTNVLVNQLDFRNIRYPATSAVESNTNLRSYIGPYLATGSSGPGSSAQCVGRYGVQDTIGSASEWTADNITCTNETSCNLSNFDNSNMAGSIEDMNTTSIKITALYNYASLRVTTAHYPFFYSNHSQFNNFSNGFADAISPFISLTTGLPLSCGGAPYTSCQSGSVYTDDIRFSPRVPHPLANEAAALNSETSLPDYANSRVYVPYKVSSQYQSSNVPLDTSIFGLTFIIGSFPCADYSSYVACPATAAITGRYSYSAVTPDSSTAMVGGRCSSFIKEDPQGNFSW